MDRRILLLTGRLLADGLAVSLAGPAEAATTGTTTTFTGGALSVTTPATAALGSTSPGAAASASLGAVTVTDQRAALAGKWVATASSGPFTTGAASADETVANSAVTYLSVTSTGTTGVAMSLPGQAVTAASLGSSVTAFSASATVGNNPASWNPTRNSQDLWIGVSRGVGVTS